MFTGAQNKQHACFDFETTYTALIETKYHAAKIICDISKDIWAKKEGTW